LPEHTVLALKGYPAQNSQIHPKVIVFRAAEYAQYGELAAKTIAALQNPYSDGQPLPDPLKCTLCAQLHGLRFQNGGGIRLLEQTNTWPAPVNNSQLYYSFRGLTDDGQYYLQVELPIQAQFLAADDAPDAPLPAGGVPFDGNNYSAYLAAVRQKLGAAASGDFASTIDQLDALIASLKVTGL
jgi:hypothetical protein